MRILLLVFLFCNSAIALEIKQKVDFSGNRWNQFYCSIENQEFCQFVCQNTSCEVKEKYCSNCISNFNDQIDYFVVQLTKYNSLEYIDSSTMASWLVENNFVLFHGGFIFNSSRWNAPSLRMRLLSLCQNLEGFSGALPMIFLKLGDSSEFLLKQNKVLFCPGIEGFFQMTAPEL